MANKLIKSGVEINHIPLGTNENKNNYGMNVYLGQSYVTTLGLLSNNECEELLNAKLGIYPDELYADTLGYSYWIYRSGGSAMYSVNRINGQIVSNPDAFKFVTNKDIAKKCVEWSFGREGNYRMDFVREEDLGLRAASTKRWVFNRVDLKSGAIIQLNVKEDGTVYQ